jgi:cytochrome b
MKNKQLLVWDLPLRLFHWLFAVSILGSWYTAEQEGELIGLHMQLGYYILGLVIFRLIWGFAGTKHSRFNQFFPTPSRIRSYFKASRNGEEQNYSGHNPFGSLMVFLMIVLIMLQALSGLFINDDIFSAGPYYGVLSDEMEKIMKFIHHNAFDVMIGAIVMHILAILYYRFSKNNDLITPMLTGKKPEKSVKSGDSIVHSKLVVAIIIAVLVAAFVYWLVVLNIPVEEEFYY